MLQSSSATGKNFFVTDVNKSSLGLGPLTTCKAAKGSCHVVGPEAWAQVGRLQRETNFHRSVWSRPWTGLACLHGLLQNLNDTKTTGISSLVKDGAVAGFGTSRCWCLVYQLLVLMWFSERFAAACSKLCTALCINAMLFPLALVNLMFCAEVHANHRNAQCLNRRGMNRWEKHIVQCSRT